ncbi:MAG: Transcriptional regulator containing an amidase domain and an AraC-type DNA-binding HTH domain [Rhodobacteraceae bacterium HLUCCA12]|nr:MAG: Transcriptional regulator containing an amidase domain and an AraC-type DNA-binding HTH domain [Rhodobacteraceae bacterium HLUCCA12]
MTDRAPLHVCLVAVPGTLAMPVAGLYEVLTAFPVVAAFHDEVPATPPFAVEIVGHAQETVVAGSGLPLTIQRAVHEIERTDIIIVPTMAVEEGWDTGRHPEIVAWMRRMHAGGAMLCSACTGLGLLAETGLLDGRQATTHWAFGPSFRHAFPNIELCLDEVLVTAGEREEFAMSGGAASWQDLALYLIGRFVSPIASQAVAKFELLERHAEGQAPYLPFLPRTQHSDGMVRGMQDWLKTNFAVASPVTEMTCRSGLSPRTFERRFKRATGLSPIGYVHQVRIDEAKRRLERTDLPIDQISWEVGYEDAAAFRRLFKRIARVTPGHYRRKFATNMPG